MSRREKAPRSISRRLDTPVTIYAPADYEDADNLDEHGSPTGAPTVVAETWAAIEGTTGGEVQVGGSLQGFQVYRVEMRRRNDLAVNHTITIRGNGYLAGATLKIESFDRLAGGRGPLMVLTCRQVK